MDGSKGSDTAAAAAADGKLFIYIFFYFYCTNGLCECRFMEGRQPTAAKLSARLIVGLRVASKKKKKKKK